MKKHISLLIFIAISLVLQAQSPIDTCKLRMIDNINQGNFEEAALDIECVKEWMVDTINEKVSLDTCNAVNFAKYLCSINVPNVLLDSFITYFKNENDIHGAYYLKRGMYALSTDYFMLSARVVKFRYGAEHPYYAKLLSKIGGIYFQAFEYEKAEQYFLQALVIQMQNFVEYYYDGLNTLTNLGKLYLLTHDYEKSERCYLSLLKMCKAIVGKHHIAYAKSLVLTGDFYFYKKDIEQMKKYYLEFLKVQRGALSRAEPTYCWEALDKCILRFSLTNDYKHEELFCKEAMQLKKRELGINHIEYVRALRKMGNIYMDKGKYSKAEMYYLKAYEISKSVIDEQDKAYAEASKGLNYFYQQTGDAVNAKKYELLSNQLDDAKSYYSSGIILHSLGDYGNVEHYLLDALKIRKALLREQDSDYLNLLYALGGLYYEIGDYRNSKQYYLEILRIVRYCENNKPLLQSASLNNIGLIYYDQGEYDKALVYYTESLQIKENTSKTEDSQYTMLLNNIGTIYHKTLDFAKAEEFYLKALRLNYTIYSEYNPDCALFLNNLGKLYTDKSDYTKAEECLLNASQILNANLFPNQKYISSNLRYLGELYDKVGDYSQAETYFCKYKQINKNRFITSTDYMTDRQREQYWNTMQSMFYCSYPKFVYHFRTDNPLISIFAYDNELFVKGLLINSSTNVRRSILESNDTTLIRQWNDLTAKKQQIQVLQERGTQSDFLSQLQTEAEELEKLTTKSSSALRQSRAQWSITWDSVRTHLEDDRVAIEYFSAPLTKDSTMYCALLLRHNSQYPELIPLFEEKEAVALIKTANEAQNNQTYSYNGNGEALQQVVWSKLLPYLNQGETIYFAPSGLLHQLAIEALPYDKTRTMADVFNLVRLSSTRELVLNRQYTTHTTATLYGGIQYNMSGDELLAESEQYATANLLVSRGIDNDTLNRGSVDYLHGSKTEVEKINHMLLQNNLQVQLFTSTAANEESFKALSGTKQNILHIATHGFFWTDSTAHEKEFFTQRMLQLSDHDRPTPPAIDPLNRCGLLLAGANTAYSGHSADLPEGVQDGVLTAKEISLLDLRGTDLVVLSACETGKGEITGDGVFGLQRAFKQAGVQTIIMSLWKVNDHATQLLMTEFYRNWITLHQSKREAFRNAQNTVRAQYAEPVYWAGFIMLD